MAGRKMMQTQVVAHKVAWWQVWISALVVVMCVSVFQLNGIRAQGTKDAAVWQETEERMDKHYVDYFCNEHAAEFPKIPFMAKAVIIPRVYAFQANFFRLEGLHWQDKTVRQLLYWSDALVVSALLELFGIRRYRKRKAELKQVVGQEAQGGNVAHPDLIYGPRGFRTVVLLIVLGYLCQMYAVRHTVGALYGVWILLLVKESFYYASKGGKLDFSAVPETFANITGIFRRKRKKTKRARQNKKKNKQGFLDRILGLFGLVRV